MNHKFCANTSEVLPDPSLYKRFTRRLIYLTNTRLDIRYAVNYLSQFVSVSTSTYHQAEDSSVFEAHSLKRIIPCC